MDNKQIKEILENSKKIAMIGVSSNEKDNNKKFVKRRPSIIVMKYLQEFGYQVTPVNPSASGKKICGEKVFSNIEDIPFQVDIVNVFRPSIETPAIAQQAAKIGAKVLWLQYGIHHQEAQEIALSKKIFYVSNKCIKQEYQKLFLKVNPVFPVVQ